MAVSNLRMETIEVRSHTKDEFYASWSIAKAKLGDDYTKDKFIMDLLKRWEFHDSQPVKRGPLWNPKSSLRD